MKLTTGQRGGFALKQWNRDYMERTGQTAAGTRLWTREEVSTLRRLYPDYAALVRALPRRTRKAIEIKATKLHISRPLRVWAPEEFRTVAGPYRSGVPISEVAALTNGKSKDQIWRKAGRERVRRPRRLPKLTGVHVVDAVRRRAFDLNFTMRDLAEEAGAGSFLTANGQVRWRPLLRAISALGGRLDFQWR